MKRFALIAAAAACLAAPAAFAQSAVIVAPHDVLDHAGVVVSPPIDSMALPMQSVASVAIPSSQVVVSEPNTAILGGPAASLSSSSFVIGGSAILDVPAHAVTRPDFQRWIAFEGSRIVGRM